MSIDYTREHDLEDLTRAMEKAKTNAEKQHYEKIMFRVLGESDDIKYWREQLLRAVRINDHRRKSYVIAEIQKVRLNETSGHSWGNNKGNREAGN